MYSNIHRASCTSKEDSIESKEVHGTNDCEQDRLITTPIFNQIDLIYNDTNCAMCDHCT